MYFVWMNIIISGQIIEELRIMHKPRRSLS